jgi:CDP-diacylglycerol--serine O-phosphatidyltransferase
MLTYLWFFSRLGPFSWVFAYAFVVCVALRLARYNVHATSEHKTTFSGLPSPAAGMTLATYYPFTQTGFYQSELSGLPWAQIMVFLTIALSLAMVSNVRYARLPRMGFRTRRGLLGLGVNLIIVAFGVWARDIFFFPLGLAYLTYGLLRAAVEGLLERAEDAAEERARRAGMVIHGTEPGARTRRREPGIKDG